jgi:hypothetical protein
MARRIHFSRLLDIISGSALAGASTKIQKGALNKDFDIAKLESKRLRDLIDANLPTFYVVDIDTIVYSLVQGLGLNNFQENEEYVNSKFPSKSELLTFLEHTIKEALHKLPRKPFMPTVEALNKQYKVLLDTLANRSSYVGYRNAATKFGASLRTTLKSSGVYVASDGPALVGNLSANSLVVIGPTFKGAVEKVNTLLNEELRSAFTKSYDISLRPYGPDAANRFTIGDFVNAGHTAAYTGKGDLIGVNMPFAQERQFLLSGDPKSEGIETSIADLYLTSDYAIKFTQNYSETATNLLDMQFSFVVTMPQKFNTATLRTQELSRIRKYIGDTVLPTIVEQAKKKFVGGILQDTALNTAASPTLIEYYEGLLVSKLKGEKAPRIAKASASKKKNTSAIPISVLVKAPKKLTVKTKKGGIVVKPQDLKTTPRGAGYSLTDLQSLINMHLQDVISANMGDGKRKDVLNYRTGRLAASATVDGMSESRSGMITAFYSYMKNPYATFSEGGRQQNPKSRDPKLLIGTAIREIAATKVGTRLRAVSI